jgi:hypothetical protein
LKVSLGEQGVPFVITYRKILRKPKMTRERRFVGAINMVKNLIVKAIETIEDVAFETSIEEVDPGQSVSVHWAVTIPDAYDPTTGREKNLVAFRMLNDMPPCGAHFEIISPPKEEGEEAADERPKAKPQTNLVHDITPEQFELLRLRQEQQALLAETREANGDFRRPPSAAYDPRPVKTLDEEIAEADDLEEVASPEEASVED